MFHYFCEQDSSVLQASTGERIFDYIWLSKERRFARYTVKSEDPNLGKEYNGAIYLGYIGDRETPVEKHLNEIMIFSSAKAAAAWIRVINDMHPPFYDKQRLLGGDPTMLNGYIINIEPNSFPINGYDQYEFGDDTDPLVLSLIDVDGNYVSIPPEWEIPCLSAAEVSARIRYLRSMIGK